MNVDDLLSGLTITPAGTAFAAAALLVAWFLSRLARRAVMRVTGRLEGVTRETRTIAARATGYLILIIGAGLALSALGVHTQPLLMAVILVAIVGGLALRGIADNFASGVVIQTRRPIRIGDEISSLGETGVVDELNGRSVVVTTVDGRRIHLPNRQVMDNPLENHSALGARRTKIEVGAREVAPTRLADLLTRIAVGVPIVLADPAPTVITTAVLSSRTVVQLRIWHDPLKRPTAASDTINAIVDGLRSDSVRLIHIRVLPD